MFYTIYKITNQINGKFYIGSHKTNDLDDGYMGSGKYLTHAQDKHGIENFEKTILFVFDTAEDMYAKEAEIVNEDFLARKNTYNLKIGGFGGWDYVNTNVSTEYKIEAGKKGYAAQKAFFLNEYGVDHISKIPHVKEKRRKRMSEKYPKNSTWYSFEGKTHTEETKRIIGEKNSVHQKGQGNSQYGTMWVTNGIENLKIKIGDDIPEGWYKGRKLKSRN